MNYMEQSLEFFVDDEGILGKIEEFKLKL